MGVPYAHVRFTFQYPDCHVLQSCLKDYANRIFSSLFAFTKALGKPLGSWVDWHFHFTVLAGVIHAMSVCNEPDTRKQVEPLKTQVLHSMNFLLQYLASLPVEILHRASPVSLKYLFPE